MKLRTRRSAAKRFKLTGTGKIKRGHSHHSHILTKKSSQRKRNLKKSGLVSAADEKRVKRMLRIG